MSLILLLIAHLAGDFIFQPQALAVKKKESFKYQIIHAIIYTISLLIVFALYLDISFVIIFTIASFIIHFIIDYVRIKIASDKKTSFQVIAFIIDQLLHL